MFVVTNRNLVLGAKGFDILGKNVNEKGPAELRFLEVERVGDEFQIQVLPDTLTQEMKEDVGVEEAGDFFASEYVFRKVAATVNPKLQSERSRKKGKDLLLFVHGFNNSFSDVVERCYSIMDSFDNLEVLAFTWPANGGGAKGVTDYLDDKRDALASVVAFDRVLARTRELIERARRDFLDRLTAEAQEKFPDSSERQREMIGKRSEQHCPFRVSLMLHSMGNYLFERTLKSSALRGSQLVFDNILMVAADVNNPGHVEWVEKIQVRNRLYITINEDDYALAASRVKGGDEQLARLGHYPYNLDARQAVYVDFTNAPHVGNSHAYFEGGTLKNDKVKKFFDLALHGLRVEDEGLLKFDASRNLHRIG